MNFKRIAAIAASAFLMVWLIHFATNHFQQYGSIQGHTRPATEGASAMVRSLRPVYPYSVIPGGVYSPRELQFADSKDTVVKQHYADFDLKNAKLVTLTDDHYQYVSYRVKDQVYWTKKRLRIPKGELLVTDGKNFARTRCGNRLSEAPQKAVRPHDPDPAALSLPAVNPKMLPKMALANAPVLGDMPASGAAIGNASSGALAPVESTPNPIAVAQPMVPFEPIWGGQPVVGGGGTIPGGPVIAGGGGSSPGGTGTTGTTGTGTGTTTNPNDPGTTANPTPVPEPSTIYLFLVSLGVSSWALLRFTPKEDGTEKKQ